MREFRCRCCEAWGKYEDAEVALVVVEGEDIGALEDIRPFA